MRLRASKDAKTVASNFAWLSVLQIASYVFPLITMPYLAKTIGVDGFGKIAFASSINIWILTIADWGFNLTATRDVSKCRDNLDKVSDIFSNVFWARFLLAGISLLFLFVLILTIPKFRENAAVILITYLMIPGHILYPEWLFQAVEKMKYTTLLNVLSKFLFTIAIFIFIKEKEDYLLQPLFTSLGFVVSGIIAMVIIKRWGIQLRRPSLCEISDAIKSSADVFLNNLMPNLYNSFSTILLGICSGSIATGLLEAGAKFIHIGQQFMGIISRAFYPYLSRRLDQHNLYVKINLSISILMSIGLVLSSNLLIRLFFTPDFSDSVLLLRILAISIPFIALNNIYGTNYMILAGHERTLRNTTMCVSIIGFALAFPFIHYLGSIGAAINIAVTRGLLGISITIKAISIKKKAS